MIDLFGILVIVFIIGALVMGMFKLLLWAVILPIKIVFGVVKLSVGALFIIPALLVAFCVAAAIGPVALLILAIIAAPILIVAAGLWGLLKALF